MASSGPPTSGLSDEDVRLLSLDPPTYSPARQKAATKIATTVALLGFATAASFALMTFVADGPIAPFRAHNRGGFSDAVVMFELAETVGDVWSALGEATTPGGLRTRQRVASLNVADFFFMLAYTALQVGALTLTSTLLRFNEDNARDEQAAKDREAPPDADSSSASSSPPSSASSSPPSSASSSSSVSPSLAGTRRFLTVGAWLAFVALIGDALENVCMFLIASATRPEAVPAGLMAGLFWTTRAKWTALFLLWLLLAFAYQQLLAPWPARSAQTSSGRWCLAVLRLILSLAFFVPTAFGAAGAIGLVGLLALPYRFRFVVEAAAGLGGAAWIGTALHAAALAWRLGIREASPEELEAMEERLVQLEEARRETGEKGKGGKKEKEKEGGKKGKGVEGEKEGEEREEEEDEGDGEEEGDEEEEDEGGGGGGDGHGSGVRRGSEEEDEDEEAVEAAKEEALAAVRRRTARVDDVDE